MRNLVCCLFLFVLTIFLSNTTFALESTDKAREDLTDKTNIAVDLLQAEALKGVAEAQFLLGFLYAKGQSVPQDYKEAAKWFRLAADQGDAAAQYNLGGLYDNGQGVPQNYKEAVKWYRLAAEQGLASAQSNLGVMYGTGHGAPQNNIEAYAWFAVSAANGNENARNNMNTTAPKMTQTQIDSAQQIAKEYFEKTNRQ